MAEDSKTKSPDGMCDVIESTETRDFQRLTPAFAPQSWGYGLAGDSDFGNGREAWPKT